MTTKPKNSGGTGSDLHPSRANRVQPFDRAAAGQSSEIVMQHGEPCGECGQDAVHLTHYAGECWYECRFCGHVGQDDEQEGE